MQCDSRFKIILSIHETGGEGLEIENKIVALCKDAGGVIVGLKTPKAVKRPLKPL